MRFLSRLLVSSLGAAGLAAQTLAPVCPSGPFRGGQTITCQINLAGGGGPAALQWTLALTGAASTATVTQSVAGTAGGATGKNLTCGISGKLCLAYGPNTTAIADGTVATASITLPPSVPNGTLSVATTGTLGASPAGSAVVLTSGPTSSVSVNASPCDINGDGQITAADVTAWVSAFFGTGSTDVNVDGKRDVVDLQIVIKASLGGTCAGV